MTDQEKYEKKLIDGIFNQMKDNQRLSCQPLFDPDAHTREEYLEEADRIDRKIKERGRFLKLLLRLK